MPQAVCAWPCAGVSGHAGEKMGVHPEGKTGSSSECAESEVRKYALGCTCRLTAGRAGSREAGRRPSAQAKSLPGRAGQGSDVLPWVSAGWLLTEARPDHAV